MSCDHGHVPLYCPKRKRNLKENKIKNKIKIKKENQKKILVSKHTITLGMVSEKVSAVR